MATPRLARQFGTHDASRAQQAVAPLPQPVVRTRSNEIEPVIHEPAPGSNAGPRHVPLNPQDPPRETLGLVGLGAAEWVPWLEQRLALAGVRAAVVPVDRLDAAVAATARLVVRLSGGPGHADAMEGNAPAGSPGPVVCTAPTLLLCDSPGQIGPATASQVQDVLFAGADAYELAWRLAHWWERSPATHGARLPVQAALHHKLQTIAQASPALLPILLTLPRMAQAHAPVLVSGETGTGKELFARAVHYLSARADRALVAVNCAALPPELVDSEFFGHVRGAFTGAHQARSGLIAQAEGGTLFLDEVDSLPLPAQGKLLRVLQEQEYRPVGADRTLRSNVRVVAATNRDVEALVRRGEFRQDLYYRLKVLTIPLPPLRERRQDIWHLAAHFMARHAAEYGTPRATLSDAALRVLAAHDWPGNVRELEHVIERACLLHAGAQIEPHDLDLGPAPQAAAALDATSFREAKQRVVDAFERGYLEQLLSAYQGNVSRAAAAAQKNRRALWELLRRHGIDPQQFRPAAQA